MRPAAGWWRQRVTAVLMILVQVVALEYMLFGFEWFPVVLAVLALAGLPGTVRVKLSRRATAAAAAILALFVWYGTQSFLFSQRLPVLPFLPGASYPLGWYLLTAEVGLLFLRTRDDRLPVYFPVMGVAVMAYAGLSGRHGSLDPVYHAASLGFIVLMLLFFKQPEARARQPLPGGVKWRGYLAQGMLVLAAFAVAVSLSTAIGVYRTGIDLAVFNLLGGMVNKSSVGFSTKTRLGSIGFWSSQEGEAVALRVDSHRAPGYLRGRAYDWYQDGKWSVTVEEVFLPEVDAGEGPQTDLPLFQVRDSRPPYQPLRVLPAASFEGCLFAPLETCFVGFAGDTPTGDGIGNLRVSGPAAGSFYEVFTAPVVRENLKEPLRTKATALAPDLDPQIGELAGRLFAGCDTTLEKIAATTGYFQSNYRYNLGIDIPENRDPLAYFLLEQPPAHCEYFASGAAVLLRLGGVPARYVTGFVAAERNGIGAYWIARNKDAHAWVEAWDDEARRWMTVEATVAEGLPGHHGGDRGLFAQLKDYAGYLRQRVKAFIASGIWKRKPRLPVAWVGAGAGLALLIVLTYVVRKRVGASRKRPVQKPELRALLRLRKQADRKVRRCGFVRGADETIYAFATRLSSADHPRAATLRRAAEWYRLYNVIRFRYSAASGKVDELKNGLAEL